MSINIAGILRNYKRRKINIFNDDDGLPMPDKQARQYLKECVAKGWVCLPVSNNGCEGFDYLGGGCPGHEVVADIKPLHT
jgi:hypothetical protein